jgi:uncharacterized protein
VRSKPAKASAAASFGSGQPRAAVHLLDGNVLLALATPDHIHHDAAAQWFAAAPSTFVTCPITQGTLVRMLMREGKTIDVALAVLRGFTTHPRHTFWSDDLPFTDIAWRGVVGHRQVTDAYLAALVRLRKSSLLTFDRGLAALHPDVAVLLG